MNTLPLLLCLLLVLSVSSSVLDTCQWEMEECSSSEECCEGLMCMYFEEGQYCSYQEVVVAKDEVVESKDDVLETKDGCQGVWDECLGDMDCCNELKCVDFTCL